MKEQTKTKLLAESIDGNDLKWPLAKGTFKPDVVYLIDNFENIKSQRDKLWNIVQRVYAKIGGYKGHDNARRWFKDAQKIKLVLDKDGKIAAFALYSNRLQGHKCFCTSKNPDVIGSTSAVKLIANDDITDLDGYYWIEASGGIEQIFKEMNGNPIPNDFAQVFLGLHDDAMLELQQDGVHYKRKVGRSHDIIEKMIFGFKTKELAKKVCSSVANYEEFKLSVNADKVVESLFEAEDDKTKELEWAIAVANKLNELANEWQCHEMLPTWSEPIHKAKALLEKALKEKLDKSKLAQVKSNLETIKYCLHDMVLLKVHQFDAKKALSKA